MVEGISNPEFVPDESVTTSETTSRFPNAQRIEDPTHVANTEALATVSTHPPVKCSPHKGDEKCCCGCSMSCCRITGIVFSSIAVTVGIAMLAGLYGVMFDALLKSVCTN